MIELISFPELVENRRWAHRSIERFKFSSDLISAEVPTRIQPMAVGYKKLNLLTNSCLDKIKFMHSFFKKIYIQNIDPVPDTSAGLKRQLNNKTIFQHCYPNSNRSRV